MALYSLNIMCFILKSNLTFTLNYQALNKKVYHQKVKNVARLSFINIGIGAQPGRERI